MNIYDFTVMDNKGQEASLRKYEGKVLLVINTATKCGLTPQYEEIQTLYDKYRDHGFEILDFPSNQFLSQAPGTDEEIDDFCNLHYNTTFPRFTKVNVNGKNTHPLFVWLKQEKPEDLGDEDSRKFEKKVKLLTLTNKVGDIKWNFGKFLIDRQGNVVERFSPAYSPQKLEGEIERLLG